MGYGSYVVMPIPYSMALTWFLGSLVEAVVAGLIVGFVSSDSGGVGIGRSTEDASGQ